MCCVDIHVLQILSPDSYIFLETFTNLLMSTYYFTCNFPDPLVIMYKHFFKKICAQCTVFNLSNSEFQLLKPESRTWPNTFFFLSCSVDLFLFFDLLCYNFQPTCIFLPCHYWKLSGIHWFSEDMETLHKMDIECINSFCNI